ncbi:Holliday junction branch migration protein RuvA [Candidatus Venteria ishoeyi]|uniref:Holliday junction branch migration protein RuvA n=1 Tax=Candidatus Venteria ishoeyi TaxID=1899563 RepID=UPI0025A660E0|nr:Holliday junction branch migration protein RuvA [Candidatus Venteria ishoeyi]MDM8547847.1 Holliday junction branch migration protein RuvA [Candidatus Venteria ishoeyi]
MIGRLRGTLQEKQPPWLVIDVQGVGYEVEAPMSTFYKLPDIGTEIHLFTHLTVREDAHLLYAFDSENERRFFRALLKVNGVGPKLALGILSGIEVESFIICINEQDTARLTRLPGVGKKTAERLIVEMRDRLKEWGQETTTNGQSNAELSNTSGKPIAINNPKEDAISALIALGYNPKEAGRLVNAVDEKGDSSEVLIRKALQAALGA